MNEKSLRVLVSQFVHETEARTGSKTIKKGGLFYALKLVAKAMGKDPTALLERHSISESATLYDDEKTLCYELGFRKWFIMHSNQYEGGNFEWPSDNYVRRDYPERVILAAAFILLFSGLENLQIKPASQKIAEPARQPKIERLVLALVLKARDAKERETTPLDLEGVEQLLVQADYFACLHETEMSRIRSELSREEGEIDWDSEQYVFYAIPFEHSDAEQALKSSSTKLALRLFLAQAAGPFTMVEPFALSTTVGLNKLGFVRT